jgi:hypothetical protein
MSLSTPIESVNDTRLVTLIGVAISVLESLALERDENPDKLLSDHLFLTNKYIHSIGGDAFVERMKSNYPMLEEAIK